MRIIYVSHPLLGDNHTPENITANRMKVDEICQLLAKLQPGVLVLSPIRALSFESADAPDEYIFDKCRTLLLMAHELWLCGDWENSKVCQMERDFAETLDIPILDCSFTYFRGGQCGRNEE